MVGERLEVGTEVFGGTAGGVVDGVGAPGVQADRMVSTVMTTTEVT